MLKLVVGPFPALERELAQRLRNLRSGCTLPLSVPSSPSLISVPSFPSKPPIPNLLSPVAVLAPSRRLLSHLQRALARDHQLALANVFFETFQSFARRLLIEGGIPAARLAESAAVDERLVERALDHLPADHPLHALQGAPGLLGTLLATLRDLDEARVIAAALDDPQLEEVRGAGGLATIQPLLLALEEERRAAGLLNRSAIVAQAAELAPTSKWLGGFIHVFHYGAYDLTQHQLDWLAALGAAVETTVLFPGMGEKQGRLHPAYRFAEPTLAEIRKKAGEHEQWVTMPEAPRPDPTVIEAGDPAEEYELVAEEIRRLIDAEGFRTSEIVVVARSLEDPLGHVAAALARAGVPWETPSAMPLPSLPAGRGLLSMADALAGKATPSVVVELSIQPWLAAFRPRSEASASRASTTGLQRIAALARRLPPFVGSEDWEAMASAADPDRDGMDIAAARAVAKGVRRLEGWAGTFEKEAPWTAHVAVWVSAFEALVPEPGEHIEVLETGLAAVEELRLLDPVEPVVTRDEFHARVRRALERATLVQRDRKGGVRVLSAMDARGVRPRALFITGANDGVFPRVAHEDPFLRDDARRVLNDPMGFKIQTKRADGSAEERLLFDLLSAAPTDRLIVSWHTENGRGNPTPVSPLVQALLGTSTPWPKRARETAKVLRVAARAAALGAVHPANVAAAIEVVRALDQPATAPTDRDGPASVGGHRPLKLRVTQLRDLAKCSYRVYLGAALKIDPPRGPRAWWELEAWRIGNVLHQTMDEALPRLHAGHDPDAAAAVAKVLPEVLAKRFASIARLPVLIAAYHRDLGALAALALAAEQEHLMASGLTPQEYEERFERPFGSNGLTLSFQADRLDRGAKVAHVTDYKSHMGRTGAGKSAKLDPDVLQVALYLHLLAPEAEPAFSVVHLGTGMRPPVQPVREDGPEARELTTAAIALANILEAAWRTAPASPWPVGLVPRKSDWEAPCAYCDFRTVCRGDHLPTRRRLETSVEHLSIASALPQPSNRREVPSLPSPPIGGEGRVRGR